MYVHFEDKGQDILNFTISFYPDFMFGEVVDSNAQRSIWVGNFVLSGKPKKGGYIKISKSPKEDVLTMNYKLTKVEFPDGDPTKQKRRTMQLEPDEQE